MLCCAVSYPNTSDTQFFGVSDSWMCAHILVASSVAPGTFFIRYKGGGRSAKTYVVHDIYCPVKVVLLHANCCESCRVFCMSMPWGTTPHAMIVGRTWLPDHRQWGGDGGEKTGSERE